MANYTDQELIAAAASGNGVTTGSTWEDSFGVVVPREYARFIRSVGECFGIQRWTFESYMQYYPSYGYDENNLEIVRLDQGFITEVMTFLTDNNAIAALENYLYVIDGPEQVTAWEDSGMSQFNDIILQGSNVSDFTQEEKNFYAEMLFWRYYIRNYGDIDPDVLSYDYTSTSNPDGQELSNYFNPIANEFEDSVGRGRLIKDLKRMLIHQLSDVTEAIGYDPDATLPEPEYSVTDEDFAESSGTFYANQLTTYNTNYKDAITKIDNIIGKINKVYDSVKMASGSEVTKIKNDLTALLTDLDETKTKITSKKKKTNDNADSCQRCYTNWRNRDKTAVINTEDGLIYTYTIDWTDEEHTDVKKTVDKVSTIEEMLNS